MIRSFHLSGTKDHEGDDQQQESSLHSWQEAHGVHRSEQVFPHIYIFIQSPTKKIKPPKKNSGFTFHYVFFYLFVHLSN